MTRERLVKAITAHAPDGEKAVERVLREAKEGKLRTGDGCRCLLGCAWRGEKYYDLPYEHLYVYSEKLAQNGEQKPHGFSDVVYWFDDAVKYIVANKKVVEILSNE